MIFGKSFGELSMSRSEFMRSETLRGFSGLKFQFIVIELLVATSFKGKP